MKAFLMDESGQAVIEFMLLMLVIIGIVGALKLSIKNLTVKLWSRFGKRIAGGCPDCHAGVEFDL